MKTNMTYGIHKKPSANCRASFNMREINRAARLRNAYTHTRAIRAHFKLRTQRTETPRHAQVYIHNVCTLCTREELPHTAACPAMERWCCHTTKRQDQRRPPFFIIIFFFASIERALDS